LNLNKFARKTSDIIEKITAGPLIIIGGLMVIIVLTGTFFRYVLNNPLLWTEEAARYLMIWMALIAASISLKRREHVGIKILVNRLNPKVKKIVVLITKLFMAYFLYILIKEGFQMVLGARTQISPALRIPMSWPLLSVPLAGFFTLLQLILQIIIDITEEGG